MHYIQPPQFSSSKQGKHHCQKQSEELRSEKMWIHSRIHTPLFSVENALHKYLEARIDLISPEKKICSIIYFSISNHSWILFNKLLFSPKFQDIEVCGIQLIICWWILVLQIWWWLYWTLCSISFWWETSMLLSYNITTFLYKIVKNICSFLK